MLQEYNYKLKRNVIKEEIQLPQNNPELNLNTNCIGSKILHEMDLYINSIISLHSNIYTFLPNKSVFQDWKILCKIGAGTFASVYQIQNIYSGDIAAAKLLTVFHNKNIQESRVAEMICKETKFLLECQCNGVIGLKKIIRGIEGWLLVQEFVKGGTLWANYYTRNKNEEFFLFLQLLQTVMLFQDKRIHHRDLKPTNILRNPENNSLVIIDFGWADSFDNKFVSLSNDIPGTIEINPPELFIHQSSEYHKIDNYALALNLMLLISHRFICRRKNIEPIKAGLLILKKLSVIRRSNPLPGFNEDSWNVFLGLSDFNTRTRYTLSHTLYSLWSIKMLIQLILDDFMLISTNLKIMEKYIWHPSVKKLFWEIHCFLKRKTLTNSLNSNYYFSSPITSQQAQVNELFNCHNDTIIRHLKNITKRIIVSDGYKSCRSVV